MKKILLTAILIIVSVSSAYAYCGLKPLKPLTPLGCSDLVAQCICDQDGDNCLWKWICIE